MRKIPKKRRQQRLNNLFQRLEKDLREYKPPFELFKKNFLILNTRIRIRQGSLI